MANGFGVIKIGHRLPHLAGISPAVALAALPPVSRRVAAAYSYRGRRAVLGVGFSFLSQFINMSAPSLGAKSFVASARQTGAIEKVLENVEWPGQFPFKEEDFQRFDESPDTAFYESPRFVTHIDDPAIAALTRYYSEVLPPSNTPGVAILDMCSSWVSHYPKGYKQPRIAGMGLNEEELKRNPVLTEHVVQDLNVDPKLPFEDNTFDVITNVVSVDYLSKPIDIFKEMARILKPGGLAVMSFSNRCFWTKAISIWTSTGDADHVMIVGSYFHYAGGFEPPKMTIPTVDACCPKQSGPVVETTPLVMFLEKVQEAALLTYGHKDFDPKLYVDLSLKRSLAITVQSFDKLPRNQTGSVSTGDLNRFVEEYFSGPEEDLVYASPIDFADEPQDFLPKVTSPDAREWALEVHVLWKNLSRKVSGRVIEEPDFHTLLPLENPVIIPGSRFREVYYWDSYWIIRGLIASKMYETAKGIVYNLIALIHQYGYVLNGARAYYTNRSQPPLLSSMVVDLYNKTRDETLVTKSLPALLKEHHFWTSGIHNVIVQDTRGSNHSLSRYYARWNQPRPESSSIDRETASKLSNKCAKEKLYRELASAAESGWDFSTRWMRDESDLTTLATTSILPVDLNAFILKMELDITLLANAIGDSATAKHFREASHARKNAINSILWNEEMKQWLDYWLTNEEVHIWKASNQNKKSYSSNFIPLWIDVFHSDVKLVDEVVESLENSGLICAAGIATSLVKSGQQWDFPNGWAPLQHMIAEGLVRSGSEKARRVAQDIVVKWIRANYVGFKETGAMHEKYDVDKCGASGGGGEYKPQTGFGWSNGVVLAFLEEFGWPKGQKLDCP